MKTGIFWKKLVAAVYIALLFISISVSCIKESEVTSDVETSYSHNHDSVQELKLLILAKNNKVLEPINADISITDSTKVIYKSSIEAKTASIPIQKIQDKYYLTVIKKGYLNSSRTLTSDDMRDTIKVVLNSTLPGTLLYYPFYGNAKDWSSNTNDGIVSEAALSADRYANENSSYYFNGSTSFIQLPASQLTTDNYTYSFKALIEELPVESEYVLISIGNKGGEQKIMAKNRIESGNGWAALAYNNDSAYTVCQNNDLIPNHWYHVAVTKSGTAIQLYVDGLLVAKKNYAVSRTTFYSTPLIGTLGTRYNMQYSFKGKIDELMIFNRVLSSEEIEFLYKN
jgi:hypothetical protein